VLEDDLKNKSCYMKQLLMHPRTRFNSGEQSQTSHFNPGCAVQITTSRNLFAVSPIYFKNQFQETDSSSFLSILPRFRKICIGLFHLSKSWVHLAYSASIRAREEIVFPNTSIRYWATITSPMVQTRCNLDVTPAATPCFCAA
jgi:hypothetical protein